jgi:hypothetical protein
MSQYKKRRRRFPFTPHTTLRPDYCSGGSFFGGHLGSCLLGTGLRLLVPESGRVAQEESGRGGEWESGPGEEWPRRRVGECLFYISAFGNISALNISALFLQKPCAFFLLSSDIFLLPSDFFHRTSSFFLLPSSFLLLFAFC